MATYSASIVLMEPWGEPLGYFNWPDAKALGFIAVFLTVLPALLAIAAALAPGRSAVSTLYTGGPCVMER